MASETSQELGSPDYWNLRYKNLAESKEGAYEWFRTFEQLRPCLERQMPKPNLEPQILHLGCGDSVRLPLHALSALFRR